MDFGSSSFGRAMKLAALVGGATVLAASCRWGARELPGDGGDVVDAGATNDGAVDLGGVRDTAGFDLPTSCTSCEDFPAEPIIDDAGGASPLPDDVATLFGAPENGDASGGPCLIEPEVGSLIPNNWLRPRFRFAAPKGQTVFEIRVQAPTERNTLVVYTASPSWTMPKSMWAGLCRNAAAVPITVTVRGLDPSAAAPKPARGTSGTFEIAPVSASGAIVYWTTTNGSALKGFRVGDESVVDVLRPSGSARCVACHTSTPDGLFIGFSDAAASNGHIGHYALRSSQDSTKSPDFLTPDALALLGREQQHLGTFSAAHWKKGDRVVVGMLNGNLIWTDLEATSQLEGTAWGKLARTGDSSYPANPDWSSDGTFIIYNSSAQYDTAGISTKGDLFEIPYANRTGGEAKPISGASEPTLNEFYPAISPDDRLIAFSRASSAEDSYDSKEAEVLVVPRAGGTAVRLEANDPTCSSLKSPGVTNSWPKWAPESRQHGGSTYYWLTFSSKRDGAKPQLYIAGVVVSGEFSTVRTYKAHYLWNQPDGEANHTPAWDNFSIPIP